MRRKGWRLRDGLTDRHARADRGNKYWSCALNLTPEIYAAVLENIHTGVYIVDPDRRIAFWNTGAERISGYLRHEVLGRRCGEAGLVHCVLDDHPMCGTGCPLQETARDGVSRTLEINLRHRDGYLVPIRLHVVPIRDSNHHIIGAAKSFEEIHPPASAGPPVEELADDGCLHNAAGVPDELMVRAAIQDHLDDLQKEGLPFALLSIHASGRQRADAGGGIQAMEKMLWVTARTLARSLRSMDFLGRTRPDRLVVVLAHCPAAAIPAIAHRLVTLAGRTSIQWWGDIIQVRVSIGAAAAHAGDTPDALLARAEEALQAGLSVGEERVVVF
jgi:PAS domain S-box-containing protein